MLFSGYAKSPRLKSPGARSAPGPPRPPCRTCKSVEKAQHGTLKSLFGRVKIHFTHAGLTWLSQLAHPQKGVAANPFLASRASPLRLPPLENP